MPTVPDSPCDPEVFREVIGHLASGVTVITTRRGGDRFGMTASAVTSLSLDPPTLLVCINRKASTRRAVSASRMFGVSILGEEHGQVAEQFAAPHRDEFEGLELRDGLSGVPLLAEALARLECQVTEEIQGGTHSVFMAVVQWAEARPGAPLAYFRGRFGRLELVEAHELGDLSAAKAVIARHAERSTGVHRRAAEKEGEHNTTGGGDGR